ISSLNDRWLPSLLWSYFLSSDPSSQGLIGRTVCFRTSIRQYYSPLPVCHIQVQHGRKVLTREPSERFEVRINLEQAWLSRYRQGERLMNGLNLEHSRVNVASLHSHQHAQPKPVRLGLPLLLRLS